MIGEETIGGTGYLPGAGGDCQEIPRVWREGFSGIFCRYLTVGNHRLLCLDDNHYCGIFHDAVDGVSVGVHSLSLATFIVVDRAGPTNLVNIDLIHARHLEGVDFLLLVLVLSGGDESVAIRSADANW